VRVEVPEVVRRHRTQLLEQPQRQPAGEPGQRVAPLGQQLRQHVFVFHPHRAHPRQVVEADLIDEDGLGLDPEQPRARALDADRDVAEADSAVASVD
jgi:hypothetical protein